MKLIVLSAVVVDRPGRRAGRGQCAGSARQEQPAVSTVTPSTPRRWARRSRKSPPSTKARPMPPRRSKPSSRAARDIRRSRRAPTTTSRWSNGSWRCDAPPRASMKKPAQAGFLSRPACRHGRAALALRLGRPDGLVRCGSVRAAGLAGAAGLTGPRAWPARRVSPHRRARHLGIEVHFRPLAPVARRIGAEAAAVRAPLDLAVAHRAAVVHVRAMIVHPVRLFVARRRREVGIHGGDDGPRAAFARRRSAARGRACTAGVSPGPCRSCACRRGNGSTRGSPCGRRCSETSST